MSRTEVLADLKTTHWFLTEIVSKPQKCFAENGNVMLKVWKKKETIDDRERTSR